MLPVRFRPRSQTWRNRWSATNRHPGPSGEPVRPGRGDTSTGPSTGPWFSQRRCPPSRRLDAHGHVAATVLGWGIELSGNNLIRTEPDGSLLLDTTYSAENSAFFYLPWESRPNRRVVIEVRMQLVAYIGERDATGCAVWFENDRYADALLIQPDGILAAAGA
jgi:hypothetical protein